MQRFLRLIRTPARRLGDLVRLLDVACRVSLDLAVLKKSKPASLAHVLPSEPVETEIGRDPVATLRSTTGAAALLIDGRVQGRH